MTLPTGKGEKQARSGSHVKGGCPKPPTTDSTPVGDRTRSLLPRICWTWTAKSNVGYREDGEGGGGVPGDALAGVCAEQREVLALAAAVGLPAQHVRPLHPLLGHLPPQQHPQRHRPRRQRRRRRRRHRHRSRAGCFLSKPSAVDRTLL